MKKIIGPEMMIDELKNDRENILFYLDEKAA